MLEKLNKSDRKSLGPGLQSSHSIGMLNSSSEIKRRNIAKNRIKLKDQRQVSQKLLLANGIKSDRN